MMTFELTPGQTAVLDSYLEAFSPTSEYDPDTVIRLNSADICRELEDMGEFDIDAVTERMVSLGYKFSFDHYSNENGWLLKRR